MTLLAIVVGVTAAFVAGIIFAVYDLLKPWRYRSK